jgi:hypothetical protein
MIIPTLVNSVSIRRRVVRNKRFPHASRQLPQQSGGVDNHYHITPVSAQDKPSSSLLCFDKQQT